MKVRDFLKKYNLTLDSEVNWTNPTDLDKLDVDNYEPLTSDQKFVVEHLILDGAKDGDIVKVVEWMRSGDIPFWDRGLDKDEVLSRMKKNFKRIEWEERAIPVVPYETVIIKNGLICSILMRFKRIDKNE